MTPPLNTELNSGEFHPLAPAAFDYVKRQGVPKLLQMQEALASVALSGNRTAEICYGTLNRILTGQGVSDRYVFGLAWLMLSDEQNISAVRPLENSAHELAVALRDALSTYRKDDKTVIVTAERQEAWAKALADYEAANKGSAE